MTWEQHEPMTEEQIAPFDAILRERHLPWFPRGANHEWFIAQDVADSLPQPVAEPKLAGYWLHIDPALPAGAIELRERE